VATPFIFHREKKLSVQEALTIAEILGVNVEGMATLSLHIDESLNMVAYGRGDSPGGALPSFASPNNWHPNWGAAIREMKESETVAEVLPEVVVTALDEESPTGEAEEKEAGEEITPFAPFNPVLPSTPFFATGNSDTGEAIPGEYKFTDEANED
jgi:hypothetical protein